jgi:hypothetical protein
VSRRSWTGIPEKMPRGLPPPIPELAFLIRFVVERLGFPSSSKRDYVINYLRHVSVNRRLPARRLLFNDMLFRIKTGPVLRSPLAIYVTDKELVKRHIAKVVGEKYNIPTLAILTTNDEIDAYEFPQSCMIKPTHASGEYIPRMSGEPLDIKRIKRWLKLDYYARSFEPNYRTLVPKIIVEPWTFNKVETTELKIMCVGGKVRTINAIADRFTNYAVTCLDAEWNETPYKSVYPAVYRKFEKPEHLAEIISVAERLARDFYFTRIDLYYDGITIKCGEITNCSAGGMDEYKPREGELAHSRMLFSDVTLEEGDKFFGDA